MDHSKIERVVKFTEIDYCTDIICNNHIYLSSPLTFNDPLDSYFAALIGRRPSPEERHFLKDYLEIAEDTYVFCGTEEANVENVLMWSHYGDNHKGLAIGYRIPKQFPGQLKKIAYGNHTHEEFVKEIGGGNPKNIPSRDLKAKNKLIEDSIFLKDKEWEYESEIRYTRKFNKNEKTFEKGWEVDSVYLGSEYLDNDDKKLKEILEIVNLCIKKEIRVYRMEYSYCKNEKRFRLAKRPWIKQEGVLEINNYSVIRWAIMGEIKKRLEASIEGEVLIELIKEISAKTAKEVLQDEISSVTDNF